MTANYHEYAMPFAAWEMRLYLDTHPDDQQALTLYHTYCNQCNEFNYACVPQTLYSNDHPQACPLRWTWVDEPWPWETCPCQTTMA